MGAVGAQVAGRVGFFLRVDDFDAKYDRMVAAGVEFVTKPRTEAYRRVAVFLGRRWQPLGSVRRGLTTPATRAIASSASFKSRGWRRSGSVCRSGLTNPYDDLSQVTSVFKTVDGVGNRVKRVNPVDRWHQVPGFRQLGHVSKACVWFQSQNTNLPSSSTRDPWPTHQTLEQSRHRTPDRDICAVGL